MIMNYYIQGDAAKAGQIKAAFEKLGYDTGNWGYNADHGFYFTNNPISNRVDFIANKFICNLIKTHPDYQELKLPVEPKFKVGDWIVINGITYRIKEIEDLVDTVKLTDTGGMTYPFDIVSLNYAHLWTIEDAKDGDVLVTTKIRNCPFIYRKTDCNDNLAHYYAGVDGDGDFCEGCLKRTSFHFGPVADVVPATKEQRDLLFIKMEEAGYTWDADKKELRKIKQHYDISNFHAGMPVLVRDKDNRDWNYVLFSHCAKYSDCSFGAGGTIWEQCIPYNEDTKHLLGTTDMCDERYVNW